MEGKRFNDVLKEKEAEQELLKEQNNDGHIALDDAKRIKVLSPGALVFKRFIRNKLAIFGSCVLIAMFLFSFICPLLYAYSQTKIFFKFDYTNGAYASASVRTDYSSFQLDESIQVDNAVKRNVTTNIEKMEEADLDRLVVVGEDESTYVMQKLGEKDYALNVNDGKKVASLNQNSEIGIFDSMKKEMQFTAEDMGEDFTAAADAAITDKVEQFDFDGVAYTWNMQKKFTYQIVTAGASIRFTEQDLGEEFSQAMLATIDSGETVFTLGDKEYCLNKVNSDYDAYSVKSGAPAMVCSVLLFNAYDNAVKVTNEFRVSALLNAYNGEAFTYEGNSYTIKDEGGALVIYREDGTEFGLLTDFAIRDADGKDTLDIEFKEMAQEAIVQMELDGKSTTKFEYPFEDKTTHFEGIEPVLDQVLNADGTPKMLDTPITVTRKTGNYELTCKQWRHLIDISAGPSSRHIFGTDTDGMDIFARMMYGGRISLMVGFIVVILETFLGIIMGGIAGYFGGWVDNLIMRLVDIFYCIPSMPILIIMGSFMDDAKLQAYPRLAWMMVILGILGWASVARLVRGQILSLREQEFMVATEATGVKVRHRIFRHLLPNVMPQLIVSATAGLGGVILTESTLSFLGLGVKHPLATWGTMINSVTASNENIIKYTYIWIPVGLLICLTVIAFNFVGDGLRDAFDPKMKR